MCRKSDLRPVRPWPPGQVGRSLGQLFGGSFEALCNCPHCDFGTRPKSELVENVRDMPFGRAQGNNERVGNLTVCPAAGKKAATSRSRGVRALSRTP